MAHNTSTLENAYLYYKLKHIFFVFNEKKSNLVKYIWIR